VSRHQPLSFSRCFTNSVAFAEASRGRRPPRLKSLAAIRQRRPWASPSRQFDFVDKLGGHPVRVVSTILR